MTLRWHDPTIIPGYCAIKINDDIWHIRSPWQLLPLLDEESVYIIRENWMSTKTFTYINLTFKMITNSGWSTTVGIDRDDLEKFIFNGIQKYHPMEKL